MPRTETPPLVVDDLAAAYGDTLAEAVGLKFSHGDVDGWWRAHPPGYCAACAHTWGDRRARNRRVAIAPRREIGERRTAL